MSAILAAILDFFKIFTLRKIATIFTEISTKQCVLEPQIGIKNKLK